MKTKPPPKSAAARQRAVTARRKAAGLIQVKVWATVENAKLIKKYIKGLG